MTRCDKITWVVRNSYRHMIELRSLYNSANDLATRVNILRENFQLETPDPTHIDALLGPLEKKQILDAGCGIGTTLLPFGPQLHTTPGMIGIDASMAVLSFAQKKQKEIGLSPLHLVHASIEDIPFPNQHFDLVLARHMLYHVDDIPQAVREVTRVIKPSGVFMATTNSMYSRPELDEIHRKALSSFPEAQSVDHVSNRFGLENGGDILKRSFTSVQTIPWKGRTTYTRVEDAIKYYTSTVYFQKALDDRTKKEHLKNMVAAEIQMTIDRQGYFQVTNWGAIFLARL